MHRNFIPFLFSFAMVGCGEQMSTETPEPPAPGEGEFECRQIVKSMCRMQVRCGHLRESQYSDCTDVYEDDLECDLARAVNPDYELCINRLDNFCFDFSKEEYPSNCKGVVSF